MKSFLSPGIILCTGNNFLNTEIDRVPQSVIEVLKVNYDRNIILQSPGQKIPMILYQGSLTKAHNQQDLQFKQHSASVRDTSKINLGSMSQSNASPQSFHYGDTAIFWFHLQPIIYGSEFLFPKISLEVSTPSQEYPRRMKYS